MMGHINGIFGSFLFNWKIYVQVQVNKFKNFSIFKKLETTLQLQHTSKASTILITLKTLTLTET